VYINKRKYFRIYANSIVKDNTIGEMGKWDNSVWKWKLEWRG